MHGPCLYLGNGSTDCAQIWYVVSSCSYRCLAQLGRGANTHVRTCTCHFYISGTAAPTALKLGMRLVAVLIGGFHNSVGVPPRTYARAHPISLYQECLDRWYPNLMRGSRITNFDLKVKSGSRTFARAHPPSLGPRRTRRLTG